MIDYIDTFKVYPHIIHTYIRDNYKCVRCGSSDKLIVHHIDESRKNGNKKMNNNLSNLITLCKPCHAKEHGYTATDTRIHTIKEMYQKNISLAEIGKKLGLSRQRIHQIIVKNNIKRLPLDKQALV